MMPLFFHAEAHLWVVYALFVNGILLTLLARSLSAHIHDLLSSPESVVVAGLLLSLILNSGWFVLVAVIAAQTQAGNPLLDGSSGTWLLRGLLFACTAVLLLFLLLRRSGSNRPLLWQQWQAPNVSVGVRALIYALVAIVLFYNGALIEQVSDAWWHLSLANTLSNDLGFSTMRAHMLGVEDRAYPPLWHVNLAVLKLVSGSALPELFNAATPWLAVAKLMAMYLFALALTQSRAVALLSLVFFIMLPGLAASYLRVSAWPSHLSYTAWFFALFAVFKTLDVFNTATPKQSLSLTSAIALLSASRASLFAFMLASFVMFFTHRVELVWLFIAMSTYLVCLAVMRRSSTIEHGWQPWVQLASFLLLVGLLLLSLYFLFTERDWNQTNGDFLLAYLLPVVFIATLISLTVLAQRENLARNLYAQRLRIGLLGFVLLLTTLVIDWRHLVSALYPELAYPIRASHEWPLQASGWLGGTLFLPGWHLQLRSGLVPLGLMSVPLAWLLAWYVPQRATVFLAAAGSVALLLCVSPYLHTWLRELLDYHSVWRVGILVFHPIVYAFTLTLLWRACRPWSRAALVPASGIVLLGVSLVAFSEFRFDDDTVLTKRSHGSAQRHWNLQYAQNYAYYDGSFRYTEDFTHIAPEVTPEAVILSDLATSYYASAYLPGSVVNVHPHQGRTRLREWQPYLQRGGLCGAVDSAATADLAKILQSRVAEQPVWYLLNTDRLNKNVRASCESNREHIIRPFLQQYGTLAFKGEYLELYDLSDLSDLGNLAP